MDPSTTEFLSLNALFDSADDGVFVLDADRRFVLFNRACERLTGRSANDVLGTACECVDADRATDHRACSLVGSLCPGSAVLDGHLPARPQRIQVDNHGQSRWLETQYVALRSADGRPRCIIGVVRDSTAAAPATETEIAPLDERLADIERRAILAAIRQAGGRRNLAARLMGISRSRLYRRLEALGIDPDGDLSAAANSPPTATRLPEGHATLGDGHTRLGDGHTRMVESQPHPNDGHAHLMDGQVHVPRDQPQMATE